VSNKFKVGDEVYCLLSGSDSARGEVTDVLTQDRGIRVRWFCTGGDSAWAWYKEQELDFYVNHPNEVKKRKETQVKKLEDYSFEITKEWTPRSVYTNSNNLQNIRDLLNWKGLEVIGFRPPVPGDTYVGATRGTSTEEADDSGYDPKEPRFIVSKPRPISDTEIIDFVERNRMGWGLTNDGYVFSYMGHHREEGKNFRESIIKHIRREERKES